MNVLHISSPKSWRGGEQQLAYLVDELRNEKVRNLVFCPFNSEVHKHCLKNNLNHITYYKGFSANPVVALRVATICARENIDIIHAHDSHAHTFAVLSASLFGNKTPMVVSRRVDFPVGNSALSAAKYNHLNVKRIICVSKAIKAMTAEGIKNPERLSVVYSGIDLRKFESVTGADFLKKEFNVPDGHLIIGNVAALAPHKDYRTFVATAKILLEQGLKARFFAIGEGPSRHEIEAFVKSEGMEGHVVLTGFLDNIPQVLKELDLFLISSETEGLGTSVLDALASGVPVVATKAGGIPEIIRHGENGLLADVKDPQGLAGQVCQLIQDKGLKERIIEHGKRTARKFSKENMARQTLAVYRDVLAMSGS